MARQSKYLIHRIADIKKYLSPDEMTELSRITQKLTDGRLADKKKTDHYFFVLNMGDQFAQPAMEAYIQSAQEYLSDLPAIGEALMGVDDALKAARNVLMDGIIQQKQKAPD